jgi:hypothetical protein
MPLMRPSGGTHHWRSRTRALTKQQTINSNNRTDRNKLRATALTTLVA